MAKKDDGTERVAMLWPTELKERVREKVGQRGLTKFALEAVEAKLGTFDAQLAVEDAKAEVEKELAQVRDLAQHLADAIATSGPGFNGFEVLWEIGLPPWMDTKGWPEHTANLVRGLDAVVARPAPKDEAAEQPKQPTPQEQPQPEPSSIPDPSHEPKSVPENKPQEQVQTPVQEKPSEPEPAAPRNDLFAKVMAKAQERGLAPEDLDPALLATMKPASEIQSSGPKSEPDSEPPAATCASCGSPLVNGECWECF